MSARKRQIPPQSRDFTYGLIMTLFVITWALALFHYVRLHLP